MGNDRYDDWQMHFEDCPDCTMSTPCKVGQEIKERLKREEERKNVEF